MVIYMQQKPSCITLVAFVALFYENTPDQSGQAEQELHSLISGQRGRCVNGSSLSLPVTRQ